MLKCDRPNLNFESVENDSVSFTDVIVKGFHVLIRS